ncbi:MAG: Histone-lysine N-methyltransferase, H3 lysine-9 specific 3 [candidate division TM6 bacterium GW2011_GWF2_32_72]|nr:MAG: Histone-lysine N-methyltransferase, H3 lysine-9 specific 3 [candidate division TM6 bacterium GW2011_GWF2_32_72]
MNNLLKKLIIIVALILCVILIKKNIWKKNPAIHDPKQIEKIFLQIIYSSDTKISAETKKILDACGVQKNLKMNGIIDENSHEYPHLLQQVMSHKTAKCYIKKISDQVGYGCFAAETIKAYELVSEYTGLIKTSVTDTQYNWEIPLMFFYNNMPYSLYMDGKNYGNFMRFVNASKNPNIDVRYIFDKSGYPHVLYIANKNIIKGEQLLVSYGKKYWEQKDRKFVELNRFDVY